MVIVCIQLYGFGEKDRVEVVRGSGRWRFWPGLRTIV